MINHYQSKGPNVFSPATNIQYVQGEAGAKRYPLVNGFPVLLMDTEEPKFYIKQTDSVGMPTMKKYKFEEIVEPEPEKIEYVTKEDFDKFTSQVFSMLQPKEVKETKTTKAKGGDADA